MALRPLDVVVLTKLVSHNGLRPTMAQLATELSLSASQVHGSLKRLEQSGLVAPARDGGRPLYKPVEEFLRHGVKYAFPARRGEITRGIPTGYAAPPLNTRIAGGADPPPVWPWPEGTVRGTTLEPLYKMVPAASLRDPTLYELLALIDAIRDGRARESHLAVQLLADRLRRLLHG